MPDTRKCVCLVLGLQSHSRQDCWLFKGHMRELDTSRRCSGWPGACLGAAAMRQFLALKLHQPGNASWCMQRLAATGCWGSNEANWPCSNEGGLTGAQSQRLLDFSPLVGTF